MENLLSNEDIAPIPLEKRTWNAFHFFSLWVGMAVCIPTYMLASSLINGGMSWKEAIFTVFLGNMIVLIPMLLNGHAGVKYGIPYPVFARASFGVLGSNVPAMLRAIVACGWFGIQAWIGGAAIYSMLLVAWPGAETFPQILPDFIGTGLIQFLCFMLFWLWNMYLIWRGVESIKLLETLCAPFLMISGLLLLAWAYSTAGGFGVILDQPSKFQTPAEFWSFFFPALTGMVGFWATLSLNITDFTRYGKSQRAQLIGQSVGLPLTMTLFAFIGIAVTSATVVVYNEAIWDPILLVRKFDSPIVVLVSMFAVLIATISTNVAANVVGPANDFSNLSPQKINFKKGGYITGVIGILIMPWKLIADPSGYIFTWLIGYSALLGPIGGILLVDYFVIRKCQLNTTSLYQREGEYWYRNGVNWLAIGALILGIVPNIPGFFAQVGLLQAQGLEFFVSLYHYAWFVGFFVSGIAYYLLMSVAQKRNVG